MRTERGGEGPREWACRGVRGATPLGTRRSASDRATRAERGGEGPRERAWKAVRSAKPLGTRMSKELAVYRTEQRHSSRDRRTLTTILFVSQFFLLRDGHV